MAKNFKYMAETIFNKSRSKTRTATVNPEEPEHKGRSKLFNDAAGPKPELKAVNENGCAKEEKPDRAMPHSEEAEQGVLGCVMLSPNECMGQCVEKIPCSVNAFYDLRNQTIYDAMLELYEAKSVIDVITLQERLKIKKMLELVGGITYLDSLHDFAPTSSYIDHYLKIICEKHLLRKTIKTCTDIVAKTYGFDGNADELVDEVERMVLGMRTGRATDEVPVKKLVDESISDIENFHQNQGKITGLATGFIDLDKVTWGLQKDELTVVAAYPSRGKTSFAMNVAEHVLLELQKPVGVFSMEMSSKSLVLRMICSRARVNLRNIREGFLSERDFPKLTSAAGKIMNSKLHLQYISDLSIFQLRAKARRMWQEHKVELIIVDYIQLLNASGGSRRMENRQQEVADISRGLKGLASELHIPVMALSQLNEDGKLRDSRAIGQDADGVWYLENEKKDDDEDEGSDACGVKLVIRKQRNGPAPETVHLTFLKSYTRFESAAKIKDKDL